MTSARGARLFSLMLKRENPATKGPPVHPPPVTGGVRYSDVIHSAHRRPAEPPRSLGIPAGPRLQSRVAPKRVWMIKKAGLSTACSSRSLRFCSRSRSVGGRSLSRAPHTHRLRCQREIYSLESTGVYFLHSFSGTQPDAQPHTDHVCTVTGQNQGWGSPREAAKALVYGCSPLYLHAA